MAEFKFKIGELVKITNGALKDHTCVVMERNKMFKKNFYTLRHYGGDRIIDPFNEDDLNSNTNE